MFGASSTFGAAPQTSTPFGGGSATASNPFGTTTNTNTANATTNPGTTGFSFGAPLQKPATFGTASTTSTTATSGNLFGNSGFGGFGTASQPTTSSFGTGLGGFGTSGSNTTTGKGMGTTGIFGGAITVPGLNVQQQQQQPAPSNLVLEELQKIKSLYDKNNGQAPNPYYRFKAFFYDFYMGSREPGGFPQELLSWSQVDPNDEETKQLLLQAMNDNPDRDRLVPSLSRGPEGLNKRLELQGTRVDELKTVLEVMEDNVSEMNGKQLELAVLYKKCVAKQKELAHRVLQATVRLEMRTKRNRPLSPSELDLLYRLEEMEAQLDDPSSYTGRVQELMQRQSMMDTSDLSDTMALTNEEQAMTTKYLLHQQEALNCLTAILKEGMDDLAIITDELRKAYS